MSGLSIARRASIFFASLLAITLMLCCAGAYAQTANASLSGIIADSNGDRIPGAKVTLVNQLNTRDKRTAIANSTGDFNFAGLSAGTYTLTASYKGFQNERISDIALHPGDNSTLPTVKLKVGAEDVTVNVTAQDEILTSDGVSSLISADQIKELATEGRDVTELVKILPGFGLVPTTSVSGQGLDNAPPDTQTVTPGGALGNYAANGSPANGVNLISDGADVQDPSTAGASTQNINMDMVQEVKITTSNFGADTAKGPVVINAVGKSGGQAYHGSVYIIGRTYQLNAQDWLFKNQGAAKPNDRYIYPGFNIGGPVVVPFTNLNKNKKLTFFVGGEDYIQRNTFIGGTAATALHRLTVPTDCMRGQATDNFAGAPCASPGYADFSAGSVANLFNVNSATLVGTTTASGANNGACNPNNPAGSLYSFVNYCQQLGGRARNGDYITNGLFPVSDIDPGAAAYLARVFPHQNRLAQAILGPNGTVLQASDGADRQDVYLNNNDLFQIRGRIDYNASQNNKFYAVYNTEQGYNFSPFTNGNGANVGGALHNPTPIKAGINSQTASMNFVHIFSSTLTSETFVAGSKYFNNFNPVNEQLNTSASLGFPYQSPYNTGSIQIPQLVNSSGIPTFAGPDYSFGQNYYYKISLDFGDNVTKVWRQHTFKVGFYWERIANDQLLAGDTQGQVAEYGTYGQFPVCTTALIANLCPLSGVPTGSPAGTAPVTPPTAYTEPNNTIGMFMLGYLNYYGQQTGLAKTDMFYTIVDGFVTDDWKLTRRLTVNVGVRIDHLGPWKDPTHIGAAFFDPKTYTTPPSAYCNLGTAAAMAGNSACLNPGVARTAFPGVTWHGINPQAPDAMQLGRWAFVSPRAGFAFNAYGNGKTVFNGGAGLYRSHDSWNDYAGPLNLARGLVSIYYNSLSFVCADEIAKGTALSDSTCSSFAAPSAQLGKVYYANNNLGIAVADPHDSQQPLTLNYSFGVDQNVKKFGNLILKYVGNESSHLLLSNGFSNNVNAIPKGGLFQPDPNPLSPYYGEVSTTPDNVPILSDYRPYPFYGNINEVRHILKSNYNAAQITLSKFTGKFHYNLNYTWSKALGDRGADGNGNAPDATNRHNDYGIAAFDRTNVFNASYTYVEGRPFHVERFLSGVINGWEISGITNFQSGPNIQASFGNNFQLQALGSGCSPTTAGCTSTSNVGNITTDNKTYLGTPDIQLMPIMTCDPSYNRGKDVFINNKCLTLGTQGVNGPFTYPYLRGPAFFNSDLSGQKTFRLAEKKAIQVRFAAFNFLNHPLTSLTASTVSPLRLAIAGPGAPANATFGVSAYKQGRRVCEVALRYNF